MPPSTIHVPNYSNFLLHDYTGKQESNTVNEADSEHRKNLIFNREDDPLDCFS